MVLTDTASCSLLSIEQSTTGGVDKFRIKIWVDDESGIEPVVCDSGLGADEYSDVATELGGGSIVMHKAK